MEEQAGSAAAPKEKKAKKQMKVKVPKWCGKWVVGMDEFKEGMVGAKSKNIAGNLASLIHCCLCCAMCGPGCLALLWECLTASQ